MSKTITIPTNCNPYVVVINNHVYTYKAGETIEVPDEVAEAIEDAIRLESKAKPSGYSKIATYTVTKGADGSLPNLITINADDDGKPFKIRDFFLTVTTKMADSEAKQTYIQIIGKNEDDIKCATGYAPVDLSGDQEKKAWIRFSTFGQDGCGGGVLTAGVYAIRTSMGLYGTTDQYTGTHVTAAPTEPDVSLKEGINMVSVRLLDGGYSTVAFTEGSKLKLWGDRL